MTKQKSLTECPECGGKGMLNSFFGSWNWGAYEFR